MIFQSVRLIARRFETRDIAPFAAYRTDPEVARYQSWNSISLSEAQEFVASMAVKEPGGGGWFQFALEEKQGGRLIGDCGLKLLEEDRRLAEIGFTIMRSHWNQGLASEAVRALLDYAFGTLGLHRVTASADPRNAASCKLLEKVGMIKEAHHRQSLWFKGEWADDVIYAILRDERTTR